MHLLALAPFEVGDRALFKTWISFEAGIIYRRKRRRSARKSKANWPGMKIDSTSASRRLQVVAGSTVGPSLLGSFMIRFGCFATHHNSQPRASRDRS